MNDDILWNMADVAEYFNTSKSTVGGRIVTRVDFPKPVVFEGFSRRWVPEEVKKWALRQRAA